MINQVKNLSVIENDCSDGGLRQSLGSFQVEGFGTVQNWLVVFYLQC